MIIWLALSPAGKGFQRISGEGNETVNRTSVVRPLQQWNAKNALNPIFLIIAPGVTDGCAPRA
jgi:hypothetical protein